MDHYTVAGTTAPNIVINLDKEDGSALPLTNATGVDLIIKGPNGNVTNTGHQSCTIKEPKADGVIEYNKQAEDFPTGGLYYGDVKITYGNGEFEIMYDFLRVGVREPI